MEECLRGGKSFRKKVEAEKKWKNGLEGWNGD